MSVSYLARLKAKQENAQKPLPDELPKLTKAPFVTFVSTQGRHVFENECLTAAPEPDQDAIEERAGLCAGSIPAPYVDAWARLNSQKLMRASEAEWRQALDDGGRFLDAWGEYSALWGWTPDELFGLPRSGQQGGLLWFIGGATVEAFGPDHASLDDGRVFDRGTIGGKLG